MQDESIMKGLRKDMLATLMSLKGFGPKSVFKIAEGAEGIETPHAMYQYISNLNEKRHRDLDLDELLSKYEETQHLIERSKSEGIGMVGYYDSEFPDNLRNCVDEKGKPAAPLVLYYRGSLEVLRHPSVAMIGTREPTPNGVKAGRYFAETFAKQGFNIVSGLAIGCDTSAHEGALIGGGKTTAFLAHGLGWDSIYPKENIDLARRIVDEGGLLLSEYSIDQPINRYQLVARDRLQAGLSNGTIVIQTGEIGGTMHAVNATIFANKPLFAVDFTFPEDQLHEKVQGNLMLFEEGKATRLNSKNVVSIMNQLLSSQKDIYQQQTLFSGQE